jgi:AcrR family transcriptional regulator
MSPRRAQAIRGQSDPETALRAHLLDTTALLLAEQVPAALTTRVIARRAGVSDGVLYNYFADKDDLVLRAMVRRFAALLERYLASLPEPGSATLEANLLEIARAALELHLESLPILAGLASDTRLVARFADEIHREHVGAAEITAAVARYLAAEQELGRIVDVDTESAADLLVGAVALRAFTTSLGASRRDVTASLPEVVGALLRGLERRA